MGLFKKNPNEVAYHEGKKHFTDVIKNTGPAEVLIWRQPEEDFNTNSTLIVMPGEKAIFVKSGKIEQVFENGTYRLSTKNYPFISRIVNVLTGGISIFNCVVFFVKTSSSFEMRWGTDSPIQVRDKVLGMATKLRCRGSYKVVIEDPAIFLSKLIGSNTAFAQQSDLSKYFITEFQSKIKSIIARAVNDSDMEILGIDARLDEFSNMIQPYMQETLSVYGLRCLKFTVSAVDIDDDELRKKYDQINMAAYEKRTMERATLAGQKEAFDVLGDNWARQQTADAMRDLASNSSSGSIGAIGAGMGMSAAASMAYGTMASQMFQPLTQAPGQPAQNAQEAKEDPMETLSKLKKMLDAGLIEKAEYDAKKSEILSRM